MPLLPIRRDDGDLPSLLWEPFEELTRLTRRLGQVLGSWPLQVDGAFAPAADVEETDEEYVVEVELPGVQKGDVTVEASGRRLVVHGERRAPERKGILRRRGRVTGTFHYEVVLPGDIDVDRITAHLQDGVLTLRAPKAGGERPRRIAVA
jgi:HSP20 family protein